MYNWVFPSFSCRRSCQSAWSNLQLSPMFGCICPTRSNQQSASCDTIFAIVNGNPCIGRGLLTTVVTTLYLMTPFLSFFSCNSPKWECYLCKSVLLFSWKKKNHETPYVFLQTHGFSPSKAHISRIEVRVPTFGNCGSIRPLRVLITTASSTAHHQMTFVWRLAFLRANALSVSSMWMNPLLHQSMFKPAMVRTLLHKSV